MRTIPIAFLIFGGWAAAQTGSFTAPVTGYVLDSRVHALRPVLGIPGAATVGAPVDAGYSLASAYVAPKQDSFFGVTDDGTPRFFVAASGGFQESKIEGLLPSPQRVAYSPSGSAAALFANGQVQIVTGLPGSPFIAATVSLGGSSEHGHRGTPTLAVSDDGAYALVGLNGAVHLAGRDGVVRPVIRTGADTVLSFAPGAHDAVLAAKGIGVVLIHDVAGMAAQQRLAGDDPALASAAGIGFSVDGGHVYVASASARSVLAFDLSGNRTDMTCSCTPAELTPMGGAFRLTELGADPLWLLDTGVSGPRVVFVPALKAAQ